VVTRTDDHVSGAGALAVPVADAAALARCGFAGRLAPVPMVTSASGPELTVGGQPVRVGEEER
jgi:hypothetical protein